MQSSHRSLAFQLFLILNDFTERHDGSLLWLSLRRNCWLLITLKRVVVSDDLLKYNWVRSSLLLLLWQYWTLTRRLSSGNLDVRFLVTPDNEEIHIFLKLAYPKVLVFASLVLILMIPTHVTAVLMSVNQLVIIAIETFADLVSPFLSHYVISCYWFCGSW